MVKLDKWLILDETAGWKDIIFLSSNFYKADSRTAGWCPQPYYTHSEPKIFFCLSCPLQSMSLSCVVCVCFPHLLPRLVWLIAKAPENQGCMSLMGLSWSVCSPPPKSQSHQSINIIPLPVAGSLPETPLPTCPTLFDDPGCITSLSTRTLHMATDRWPWSGRWRGTSGLYRRTWKSFWAHSWEEHPSPRLMRWQGLFESRATLMSSLKPGFLRKASEICWSAPWQFLHKLAFMEEVDLESLEWDSKVPKELWDQSLLHKEEKDVGVYVSTWGELLFNLAVHKTQSSQRQRH